MGRAIEAMKADPFSGGDVKRLAWIDELWPWRVGEFRIIYRIRRDARRVEIAEILPRGQSYKSR
ncbi:MAG: type II toxin-antitoxin system RelE family toxin [bacterium]